MDKPIQVKDWSQLLIRGITLSVWKRQIIGRRIAEKIKVKFHLSFPNLLKLFFIEKNELISRSEKLILGAEGRKKIPIKKIFLEKYEPFRYWYILFFLS